MTRKRHPRRPPTAKPRQTTPSPASTNPTQKATPASPRDQILSDFAALRVPLSGEQLDEVLRTAEQRGLSHLEFLQRLVGTQAQQRRERAIERRIREAWFRDVKLLEDFDWKFNAAAIDRAQIEQLATGEFVRRGDNLVFVGQSGVGKSHLIQALGRQCCVLGYHVRYTSSAKLLQDLTAALADQTLPARLNYWTRFDWLIIDEFGFDRLERTLSSQAANLLYKVIDARSPQRSTGLVTNIDFEVWADYLGDPPLAMAFMDRVVDGAILLKIDGRSYRAHRAKRPSPPSGETTS
jgi:DNA replication protein DnaC